MEQRNGRAGRLACAEASIDAVLDGGGSGVRPAPRHILAVRCRRTAPRHGGCIDPLCIGRPREWPVPTLRVEPVGTRGREGIVLKEPGSPG